MSDDAATRKSGRSEIQAIHRAQSDERGVRREFWIKLKRVGRHLPFVEDLLAAYYCTIDPATPRSVRLILLGAIAYFVMPFDAIPDILPLIGFSDDAAVIAAAIARVAGSINAGHRAQAQAALASEETPAAP